jgi:hypothetical protein
MVGRQCRAKAEPGDLWCRFHGGKAPSHQAKKDERIKDYQDQVMELADTALDTIMEKLTSPNHAVALRAALEILDRTGVTTTRKSESSVTITQRSELDARIEELLSGREPAGDAPAPQPARLPAHNISDPDAENFRPPGGHGLGLAGPGVSDDVDDLDTPF